MTLFQAIITSILTLIAEIFSLSTDTHQKALTALLGWPEPEIPLLATIYLGFTFGLVVHFRHDFLSHFSSILRIAAYR